MTYPTVDLSAPCWEWQGYRDRDGYGRLRWAGRRMRPAHVALYEQMVGPVPEGMFLHHACRNKACFNPAHLELTTRTAHPDAAPNWQSAKTHCPRGHPYDEDNTYRPARGGRMCRACKRERARKTRR